MSHTETTNTQDLVKKRVESMLAEPSTMMPRSRVKNVQAMYQKESPEGRRRIVEGLIQLIQAAKDSTAEQTWRIAADAAYLGSGALLNITSSAFASAVLAFDPRNAPGETMLDRARYGRNMYLGFPERPVTGRVIVPEISPTA